MRSWLALALFAAGCSHAAPSSQQSTMPPPAAPAAPAAAATAAVAGIDPAAIDSSVSPCDDFYQYACGSWIKSAQIPADKSSIDHFEQIRDRNLDVERGLLDADAKGQGKGKYAGKLGDYWTACMDEAAIEQSAAADLKAQLAHVDAVKDVPSLMHEVAREQREDVEALFAMGAVQDFKDATAMILMVDQGGLGLPDRDYYLKPDAKMAELRRAYVAHVAKMMQLAGEPAAQAQKDAATVMRIETKLATASLDVVSRRDPQKVYHRLELAGLTKTAPQVDWKAFLADEGLGGTTQINVAVPDFFAALGRELRKTPIADWRTYLRWHLTSTLAMALSKPFVDEHFAFYSRTLQGIEQLEPRWKRCVDSVDRRLGFALGRQFVDATFGADGKELTHAMVVEIEQAMDRNLDRLTWLDAPTRKQAHEKLAHIANKIGYPAEWRNYDRYETGKSHLQNVLNGNEFEVRRELAKIGKPVDRNEWGMTPPTVNAYYDPSMNEMVFPAGILQPPIFDRQAVKAVNYGAVGMVMGHELTHGFDDEGRQFDATGNLRDWWSPAVSKDFDQRAQCVAAQFDGYVAVDDVHVNGKLTLGENLADLGGMKLAYAAYVKGRGGDKPQQLGQWTDDQLFFLGSAQAWCSKLRPELLHLLTATNPHSPDHWRVDGPMSNLPEFAHAFACKAGDKMVRANQCSVW